MLKHRVTGVLQLPAGTVLGLAEHQVKRRAHALKPRGAGVYEATSPVQFKAGEVIASLGPLPKALASLVEPVAEAPKAAARK